MPILHTVYRVIDESHPDNFMLICGSVIFVIIIGITISIYRGVGKDLTFDVRFGGQINACVILMIVELFVFAVWFGINSSEKSFYEHDKETYNSNQLKTVEGKVTDYSPMSKDGHGYETFVVNGVEFHYSYYEAGRSGYHLVARYGGAIKPELYVRIGYYYDGDRNAILKLNRPEIG